MAEHRVNGDSDDNGLKTRTQFKLDTFEVIKSGDYLFEDTEEVIDASDEEDVSTTTKEPSSHSTLTSTGTSRTSSKSSFPVDTTLAELEEQVTTLESIPEATGRQEYDSDYSVDGVAEDYYLYSEYSGDYSNYYDVAGDYGRDGEKDDTGVKTFTVNPGTQRGESGGGRQSFKGAVKEKVWRL